MLCKVTDVMDAHKHPELQPILDQKVINIYVEFTNSGEVKPHAELRLFLEREVPLMEDGQMTTVVSCSIGSNPDKTDNIETSITFRTQHYDNLHYRNLAAFRYEPRSLVALREYLSALRGEVQDMPTYHPADLTRFVSIRVDNGSGDHFIEGCRDSVAQWVVRLNEVGLMAWDAEEVLSQAKLEPEHPPLEFHNFIAKGYRVVGGQPRTISMTHDVPMHRGDFLDRDFVRIFQYDEDVLPYKPLTEDTNWGI